jgi:hypothetical protein
MKNKYIKEHIQSKEYEISQLKDIWWFSGESNYIIHSYNMKSRVFRYRAYGINIFFKF